MKAVHPNKTPNFQLFLYPFKPAHYMKKMTSLIMMAIFLHACSGNNSTTNESATNDSTPVTTWLMNAFCLLVTLYLLNPLPMWTNW